MEDVAGKKTFDVSQIPAGGTVTIAELIGLTDEAVYFAKQRGRDRGIFRETIYQVFQDIEYGVNRAITK